MGVNGNAVEIPIQFKVTSDNIKEYVSELKTKLKDVRKFASTGVLPEQGKILRDNANGISKYIKELQKLNLDTAEGKEAAKALISSINAEADALDALIAKYKGVSDARLSSKNTQKTVGKIDGDISIPAIQNKELLKQSELKARISELSDKEYDSEKRLASIQNSETALIAKQTGLERQREAIKHDRTKAAKEERAALTEQIHLIQDKRSENTYARLEEQKNLDAIQSELMVKKQLLSLDTGSTDSGSLTVERTEKDIEAMEKFKSSVSSLKDTLKEIDDGTASTFNNTRASIKKTAAEIKAEIQGIVSTFEQQPSKDFTKSENENIKNLQTRIAKLRLDAKTAAEQLEGPWKMQVDVRGMQDDLSAVTKEVDAQKAEVAKLEQAYNNAKARAEEVKDAFVSGQALPQGEYSTEQFAFDQERIKGARADAENAGKAYDEAKTKLEGLIQKQIALENQIDTTADKYNSMVAALKADDHQGPKVEANEALMAQFESANAEADALQAELEEVFNTAKSNNLIKQEDAETAKIIEETLKGIGNEVKNIQDYGTLFDQSDKIKADEAAKAAQEAQVKAQIQGLRQEEAAIKRSTAQYYYKLRSIKMLGFAINNVTKKVNAFGKASLNAATKSLQAYLKLIPGVGALGKAFDKARNSQKKLSRETRSGIKANAGFNLSIKDLIKNILKYGLGIRSLYVLLNKMRKAVIDGMGQLAMGYDEVNKSMSSIVTSMNQIKAAITTIVEPIVHVLAPLLEKISALVSDIAYKVASFIAALTGQSMVFKATRNQIDYAESLDKTAKNAKKAKQELSGLDKLNVINSKDDSGADAGAMGFEKVPIDPIMAEWAKKFKEFLDRLLKPIKAAWAKMKKFVVNSFKYMLRELLDLAKSVARDFWRVWEEPRTQEIFENLFKILGDIFLIIGNIARAFRIAWDANENGYRILSAIRDIIWIITNGLRECADYTVLWSRKLSFVPLFTAIADVLQQQIVPAVQKVVDLFVYLYEKVLLEIVRFFVEDFAPKIVKAFGNIVEAIGNIADNLRKALEENDRGSKILAQIEKLITIIGDGILKASEKTAEWAANLDFSKLLDDTLKFLEDIEPVIQFIVDTVSAFWTDVLLPFWSYLVEDGGPRLLELLGQIFGQYDESTGLGIDWEHLTSVMNEFLPTLEKFLELGWEVLLQIIEDLGKAFDDFVNSGTLDTIVSKFSEWVENADPEKIAEKIEKFAKVMIGLIGGLNLLNSVIMPIITNFMTFHNFLNNFAMNSSMKKIEADVAKLAGTGSGTGATGLAGLGDKLLGLVANIDTVNPAILTIGSTIAGVVMTIGGAIMSIGSFNDMMQNGFSLSSEIVMGLGIAITTVGAIILGAPALVAGVIGAIVFAVANFIIAIQTMPEEFANTINKIGEFIGSIPDKFEEFLDGLIDKVKDFGHNLGVKVGEFIATAPQKFEEWKENLKTFIDKVDWMELGINILKGILYIFNLPGRLLVFIFEAIGNFVISFIKGLQEGFDMHSPSKKMEPYGTNILEGILEGIISALKNIGTWVVEHIFNPLMNGVKSAFGIVNGVASKFKEIGGNLINGLKEGITSGWDKAKSTISDIWKKVTNSAEDEYQVSSPSKVFEGIGGYIMSGLDNGLAESVNSVISSLTGILTNLLNVFTQMLSGNALASAGKTLITGLITAINGAWNTLVSTVMSNITKLIQTFNSKLSANSLVSVGRNLINGLKSGLMSSLSSALSTISNICNQITSRVRSAFQIHSPSRVFADIGELLVEGLEVGVEDNVDDVSKSFDEIVPSDKTMNNFYTKFVSETELFTTNIMDMFDAMAQHIDEVMNNLSVMSALQNFNTQFANISNMSIPDIAKGYKLPSNAEFRQTTSTTEIDLSDLPDIIRNAVIEAITSTADLQTDDGTTIINIDGKEVFQVVKDKNTEYKKRHGKSAFV